MLIPYNTDAPIYHFPYGTIGIIVTNVLIFFAAVMNFESAWVDYLVLDYATINPIQWLMSNFMHGDIMHLVGNMLFLWAFGLIVEGKLGWLQFLAIYLGIGVSTSAFEQIAMHVLTDGTGGSLGASGVIYGLMAIAVFWAPRNDVSFLTFFAFRPIFFNLQMTIVASLYAGMQIVFFVLGGFQVSSELLHLIGFAAGLPVGFVYLKRDWVDCEGWDLLTLYFQGSPQPNKRRDEAKAAKVAAERQEVRDKEAADRQRLNQSIVQALDSGADEAAHTMFERNATLFDSGRHLETPTLSKLVPSLQRHKAWETSIPLLVEWIRRVPDERAIPLRLNLATLLVQVADRPRQAIAVLKKLPPSVTPEQLQKARKIAAAAKHAITNGSVEIEIYDW